MYSENLMQTAVEQSGYPKSTDFFEVLEIFTERKCSLDGYLQHKLRINEAPEIDEIMQKHKTWARLLKQSSYPYRIN